MSLATLIKGMAKVGHTDFFSEVEGCDVYHLKDSETEEDYVLFESVDMKKKGVIYNGEYYLRKGFQLTDAQKSLFVNSQGTSCPFCGKADSITRSYTSRTIAKEGVSTQYAKCDECDADWVEVYHLHHIEEVK